LKLILDSSLSKPSPARKFRGGLNRLDAQPGDCRSCNIKVLGYFVKRRPGGPHLQSIALLPCSQFAWTAHTLTPRPCPRSAFGRAGANEIALDVGQTAQDGDVNETAPPCRRSASRSRTGRTSSAPTDRCASPSLRRRARETFQ